MTSLWGAEFTAIDTKKETKSVVEKIKKAKSSVMTTDKIIKSKTVSIVDKLNAINQEVNRVLGVYRENTVVIKTKQQLIDYIDNSIKNGIIAIDTETNNSLDPLTCKLMGPCIYTPGQKNAYIPINHVNYVTNEKLDWQLTEEDIYEQFSRLDGIDIITHNGKFDYQVLYCTTNWKMPVTWDTFIGARLIDENEKAGLKQQYIEKIDPSIEKYSIDKLFENIEYAQVNPDVFALYAATDAFMTYKLYLWQKNIFEKPDNKRLYSLFKEVEMPIMFISSKMELNGVCIDEEYSSRLGEKYHKKLDEINIQLNEELKKLKPQIDAWRLTNDANFHPPKKNGTGESKSKSEQLKDPPELTSPTQLAILLYDVLGIQPVSKETPRGTGTDILEKIDHPICQIMLEQRAVLKLLDAFIDTLPKLLSQRDNRLHSHFNQLGTDTGRFSCTEPNLQQIPSKNKEIRMMFKASPGYTFVGADFSAQEPRLTTFMSQDPNMIKAYQEGKDLYATMGVGVWHNDYWDNMEHYEDGSPNVDGKKRRSQCKKLLLGISYGMGTALTAQNMKVSVEEARNIIDTFYTSFSKVKTFIEDNEKFVTENGYVEDLWGRRRHLPDAMLPEYEFSYVQNETSFNPLLHSSQSFEKTVDEKVKEFYLKKLNECHSLKDREAVEKEALSKGLKIRNNGGFISRAKRQSTNARIQGSAATMTKKAMILIDKDEFMNKHGFKLLIGVHDELIGECPIEYAEEVADRLSYLMSHSVEDTVTNVPFKCDAEIETSWYFNEYSNMIVHEFENYISDGKSKNEAFSLIVDDHYEMKQEQLKEILSNLLN